MEFRNPFDRHDLNDRQRLQLNLALSAYGTVTPTFMQRLADSMFGPEYPSADTMSRVDAWASGRPVGVKWGGITNIQITTSAGHANGGE